MKLLSVRQPWAHLLAKGVKDVENRGWRTSYRGPLLIHATQERSERVAADVAALIRRGHVSADEMIAFGGVVGEVELVDCVDDSRSPWAQDDSIHLCVQGAKLVPFVKMKGMLGLVETTWPQPPSSDDVVRACSVRAGDLAARASDDDEEDEDDDEVGITFVVAGEPDDGEPAVDAPRAKRSGSRNDHDEEPEVVLATGVVREEGFVYFLDKHGDVSRSPEKRGTDKKPEKVFLAGIAREPGWLYYFHDGAIMRTRMIGADDGDEDDTDEDVSDAASASAELDAEIESDEPTTDDVMAAFRKCARGAGIMKRIDLIRAVARELGHQRLGKNIEQDLRNQMRAALRRDVLAPVSIDDVQLAAQTLADYDRDVLREHMVSVMRRGERMTREEVMRATASKLGFVRLTANAEDALKSALTSAIRRDDVAYEGTDVVWRAR